MALAILEKDLNTTIYINLTKTVPASPPDEDFSPDVEGLLWNFNSHVYLISQEFKRWMFFAYSYKNNATNKNMYVMYVGH